MYRMSDRGEALRSVVRLVVLLAGCAVLASGSMITVQPIMVGTLGSRVATDTTYAELIYQQMSMWVDVLPEQPVSYYSGSTLSGLDMYATGTPGIDNTNQFLGDASWQAPNEMTVWYVDHIYTKDDKSAVARGGTFYSGGRFGVAVSLSFVANDTFAHELAHMLTWYTHSGTLYFTCADPGVTGDGTPATGCLSGGSEHGEHDATNTNLLAPGSIRVTPNSTSELYTLGGTLDQITFSQSSFMVLHTDFVQDGTPEPASVVLSGSALALLLLARRRRAA